MEKREEALYEPKQIHQAYRELAQAFRDRYRSPAAAARRWWEWRAKYSLRFFRANWPPDVDQMIELLQLDRKQHRREAAEIDRLLVPARRLSRMFNAYRKEWGKRLSSIHSHHDHVQRWFRVDLDRHRRKEIAAGIGVSEIRVSQLRKSDWAVKPRTMLRYLESLDKSPMQVRGAQRALERVRLLVQEHRELQEALSGSSTGNRWMAGKMFGYNEGTIKRNIDRGWHQKIDTLERWLERLRLC